MMNFISRTDDGALVARACRVNGFYVTGDGTNSGRVIFYDNASAASGTVLMELRCGANETMEVMLPKSIDAQAGIYADVTTVGRAGAFFD